MGPGISPDLLSGFEIGAVPAKGNKPFSDDYRAVRA